MKEKIFCTARGIVCALLFYILTTFLVGIIAGSFCQGIMGDGEITKLTAKIVTYGIILVILLQERD